MVKLKYFVNEEEANKYNDKSQSKTVGILPRNANFKIIQI